MIEVTVSLSAVVVGLCVLLIFRAQKIRALMRKIDELEELLYREQRISIKQADGSFVKVPFRLCDYESDRDYTRLFADLKKAGYKISEEDYIFYCAKTRRTELRNLQARDLIYPPPYLQAQ